MGKDKLGDANAQVVWGEMRENIPDNMKTNLLKTTQRVKLEHQGGASPTLQGKSTALSNIIFCL